MGARVIHKNAFRYETRNIDDGTGRMIPRVHMIADCRKCGNESALALDAHNTQYDIGLASKKFIAIGWKMGGTRRKDVCPVCVARGKVLSAPEDERKDVSSQENLHLIRVAMREPELAEGLLIAGEPIVSDNQRAQAEMLVDLELDTPHAPVGPYVDPGAPPPGQVDLRGRRAAKDGPVVRVFKPEAVQKPTTLLGEKIIAASEVKLSTALDGLKAKVAELSPEEKAKRQQALDAANRARTSPPPPVPRKDELIQLIDQQDRDDRRNTRRTGNLAPKPLPQSYRPGTPVTPKPAPPRAPLAKIIDLDDGFPKVPPILPPKETLPAVILITPEPVVETPVVKAKKPAKVELTPEEKLAKKDAYWASDRGKAQLAAQKAGRARSRAAKLGIPVEELLEREAAAAAALEASAIERERKKVEREAKKAAREAQAAERARTDPMFPPAQVEMDLPQPAPTPEPVVLSPPPEPEPEVAQPAPAPEAIKEPVMSKAEAPREPTPAERRSLYMAFVDNYYDDGRGMYRGDMSDRKLGDALEMPWAWVKDLRETTGLGPDVNESDDKIGREITALKAQLDRDKRSLDDALNKAAETISQAQARAQETISQAERALKRDIQAAETAVNRITAEGEAQRVAAEERLEALLDRNTKARR